MRNRSCVLFALIATVVAEGRAAVNPPPQVVPAVQEWTGSEKTLSLRESSINIVDEMSEKELTPVAKQLQTDLVAVGLARQEIHSANMMRVGQINMRLFRGRFCHSTEAKLGAEGYILDIGDDVGIYANGATGVFYGTRTLLQMLAQNPRKAALPKGSIIDYPLYRHRMLMLDVGRKPFPIAVLKDYLRILAWYKMNELHLHLSDEAFGGQYTGFRVQCDTFPGLTSKDCFYTKKQLRELQDMARQLGITITPEIDMPGHARVFTNYWPDLRLPGYPSYLDVTNPRTIERLKKLLDEMIPIFDAPDFHIGTDEYRVAGPRQAELHEAFRRFINTMNAHIRSKGKNCRIWSGFEHMRGKTQIDPSVTIDMWETRDAKGQIAKGHAIINSSDARTYIVPGAHYYGVSNAGIYNSWEPWMVSNNPAMNPGKDDPKLLGGKLHIWNDQGPTGYTDGEIFRLAQPSIEVFAEKLWGTKGSKDYVVFKRRAAQVSTVPGLGVFGRHEGTSPDKVVLSFHDEWKYGDRNFMYFLPGPMSPPSESYLHPGPPTELEYPWTLSVEVLKTAESGTRGVLIASERAEICTDYSRSEEAVIEGPDGKKVKTKAIRHGIGVVRAAGSRGKDAASSHLANDVSRVYSDPLPLNQWKKIVIVGQQRRTTVYVDGRKVGESSEQTLCPTNWIGSTTGEAFVGKVRNLKVWARAMSAKEVGRAAGLETPDNLAAHCPVTASASDSDHGFTPEKITDEDPGTRWSSGPTAAEQWVAIDLGKPVEFNTVTVAWETARPKKLKVQIPRGKGDSPIFAETKIGTVPAQGQDKWKDVCDIDVSGEQTVAVFPTVQAAHVRLVMSQPATQWGYSIWEVEVLKKK